MSDANIRNPNPPARLHTAHIVVATLASIISIVGGVYSLKSNLFQGKSAYGELRGFVRDEKLARPLRLATVEISDAEDQVVSTLSTDENGSYSAEDLKEGNYQVNASASMHASQTKRVNIQKNRTSTIDFILAPIEAPEPPPVPVTGVIPAASPVPAYPAYSTQPEGMPSLYYSNPPTVPVPNESVRQKQPTGTELLIKTGAVLIEQMLQKKKKG